MNNFCTRFHIVMDMNRDSLFSISDVWLIIKWIWLLPAKFVVGLAHEFLMLATFFEINCDTGESWGGAMFSFFVWFLIFCSVEMMFEK